MGGFLSPVPSRYGVETYPKVVRYLKKTFPPNCPVSVRRLRLSEHLDGDCQFRGDRFVIRINRLLPEHEAIEVALHEWAHVMAWWRCSVDDHCDEWGRAYSRVYRAFLKEFIERNP
jgi:hypothetical protein